MPIVNHNILVELTDLVPSIVDTGSHHGRCKFYDTLQPAMPGHPEKHRPYWAAMYHNQRYKLASYHGNNFGQLYDLEQDPDEFNNLWDALP
ncbi:MAG: hypothetical protein QGH37_06420 [Candidatus Poribacteria bacterium]|jgi:hypothetical protein|nr:hypothetical protein [Candidatus Poribacteria bacterium]MDP6999410.1 hypothetical protein [Candidatus Poribacteria bacterium]|tara:strand:+ start:65 stop:337 length:273 start_codon:yes stop_codon:yes gene_type:complete